MQPLEAHGLQAMSIGFLVGCRDADGVARTDGDAGAQAAAGGETNWSDLDYLVVDMPPGTGDIQLTLSQAVPVTGAVIVTTPQDIALLDARKGLKMFEKVGIPILGVVENMSIHICSKCGHEEHIFGAGGGQKMCDDYGVPFLGALPLDLGIREQTDSGRADGVPGSRWAHCRALQGDCPQGGDPHCRQVQGHDPQVSEHRGAEYVSGPFGCWRGGARRQQGCVVAIVVGTAVAVGIEVGAVQRSGRR